MKTRNTYFLLRHGKAISNKEKIVSSWPEKFKNFLIEEGVGQIKEILPCLKNERIDLIFSSDVLRAKQTAEIIAGELGLKVNFDERLREINMGIFNGGLEENWNNFFGTNENRYIKRPSQGGETYRDIKKRVADFLREIDKKYKNKRILIISHGCILFSLQSVMKNFTEEEEKEHRSDLIMKTGELKKITIDNEK
jgi:broad specificity phosphatase PhoE